MSVAGDIIQAALRETNIIPIGTTPSGAEQTEALDTLNRLISSIMGYELGEPLQDWVFPAPQRTAPVAANYPQFPYPLSNYPEVMPIPYGYDPAFNQTPYPPSNSRIVFGGLSGTLYFPEQPADGARMGLIQGSGAGDGGSAGSVLTLDGNGRTIEGTPQITLTDPVPQKNWFYRADLGDWIALQTLGVNDTMPFPQEFDDFFVTMLAIRLAPRYGKTVQPESVKYALDALKRLKAKYAQTGVTVYKAEDIPRTLQGYLSGIWYY